MQDLDEVENPIQFSEHVIGHDSPSREEAKSPQILPPPATFIVKGLSNTSQRNLTSLENIHASADTVQFGRTNTSQNSVE